jgi:hypothetical protein
MYDIAHAGEYQSKLAALPAHENITLLVLSVVAILATTRMLTRKLAYYLLVFWCLTLALIWCFFLSTVPNQGKLLYGISAASSEIKHFGAISLLTFALLWESFTDTSRLSSQGGPWDEAPHLLVLYLGLFLLMTTAMHYLIMSGEQSLAALTVYAALGARALWLPMTFYAFFYAQHSVPPTPRRVVWGSVLVGASASAILYISRSLFGESGQTYWHLNLAVVIAAEILICIAVLLSLKWLRVARPLDAAAAGIACALGFAVAYCNNLIAPLLGSLFSAGAHLVGLPFSPRIWSALKVPFEDVVTHADLLVFYLLVPASAAILGLLLFIGEKRRYSLRRLFAVAAVVVLTVTYASPVYLSSSLSSVLKSLPPAQNEAAGPSVFDLFFFPSNVSSLTYFEAVSYLLVAGLLAGSVVKARALRLATINVC